MSKSILLIVEGSVDEQTVFGHAFSRYGFHTVVCKEKLDIQDVGLFQKYTYSSEKENIVIIQGPRTRIHDFLKLIRDTNVSIEKVFSFRYAQFQNIFLIYDVDHNDCDDVKTMFELFSDESTGMLLLSSPCLEVIADYNRKRTIEKYTHLSEYKSDINRYYNGQTFDFIDKHFEEIMLYFLDKNYLDFHEPNIMEHPHLLLEKINRFNERVNKKNRNDSYVIYRYFSTVIYVAVACANSLTKEIDNYKQVREFFSEKISKPT